MKALHCRFSRKEFVTAACVLAATCAPHGRLDSFSSNEKNAQARDGKLPKIVFVMETEALPGDFSERTVKWERGEHEQFERAWQALQAQVLAQVKADSLRRISRWAAEPMKTFSLPADWLKHIALRPMASTADERIIRFSQHKEEGYPLPSHHPLVFRRLLLCADYDRRERKIVRIIVTINGWVEE